MALRAGDPGRPRVQAIAGLRRVAVMRGNHQTRSHKQTPVRPVWPVDLSRQTHGCQNHLAPIDRPLLSKVFEGRLSSNPFIDDGNY